MKRNIFLLVCSLVMLGISACTTSDKAAKPKKAEEPATADSSLIEVFVDQENETWPEGTWQQVVGSMEINDVANKAGEAGTAKEVSFNGTGVYYFQGSPRDLTSFLDGGELKFDMKVLSKPEENGTVYLRVDCVHPCAGTLDIAEELPNVGEWKEMSYPLVKFQDAGTNFKKVNTPFVIFSDGKLKMVVSNIRWEKPTK